MNTWIFNYIEQQMKKKGIENYHFKPALFTVLSKEELMINAHNQYYYLLTKKLEQETTIFSDTVILDIEYKNAFLEYPYLWEFTGNMVIDNCSDKEQHLEFLLVIPE